MIGISKPGIYTEVSERDYHADCVVEPSLSASIAKLLIGRSPMHAWHAHPRLRVEAVDEPDEPTRAMDRGTAAHALLLGKGAAVRIIDADDYKTKEARASRDEARAMGMTPLLRADAEAVRELVAAAGTQLGESDLAGIFDDGDPEVTMVWQDGGAWCRSRVDYLPRAARQGGHIVVPDLKTTAGSAHPDTWQQRLFDMGADIQAAFYERGLRALIPGVRSVRFTFVVVEQDPPYGLSIVSLSGEALDDARQNVEAAIALWRQCLATNHWPGYPGTITTVDPKPWRTGENELRRLALLDRLRRWQAPITDGKAA